MKTLTVREIVETYLKANGYGGLADFGGECACRLADLMPCEDSPANCEPGYEGPCDCGDHNFHIGAAKEDVLPTGKGD